MWLKCIICSVWYRLFLQCIRSCYHLIRFVAHTCQIFFLHYRHALSTFLMNFQPKAITYSRSRPKWSKTQHALTAGAYSGTNRMRALAINIIRTPFLFDMTYRDYNKTLPTNKRRLNNTHASLPINNSSIGKRNQSTYHLWRMARKSGMYLESLTMVSTMNKYESVFVPFTAMSENDINPVEHMDHLKISPMQ